MKSHSVPAAAVLTALLFAAVPASAHGHVDEIVIGGTSHAGYDPTNAPWHPDQDTAGWPNWATDNGFVAASELLEPSIICHLEARPAPRGLAVAAGATVRLRWDAWPSSHQGPVMDYMARCPGSGEKGCADADPASLRWFKIAERGQLKLGAGSGETGYWATDALRDADLWWDVVIPASLAPGPYVLRHELLGLHDGGKPGGAQFYPQCISLDVGGDGWLADGDGPPGVLGTELYRSDDEGVLHNIYNDELMPEYRIPGPELYVP
ncbi:hypothetical protein N3K66_002969 [Trichothecium roseum]|uniref:Uncharacterized protein n=1 Tax=Trichothecium roseum TaxID=47278 RepID=A0ACC0V4S2_9HYPO|nr:hypothetical protein N3K66_002969 [Trichothecium roseum]